MNLPIQSSELIIDLRAREWCKMPYLDHPKGCPNYDHRGNCPPKVCTVDKFFDLSSPLWLVLEDFDLGLHVAKMFSLHPGWSDRQARCVLYWQGGVNKRLSERCVELVKELGSDYVWTTCPEAMGVDVIKTVKRLGIPIVPRPIMQVIKVGLVGRKAGG